VGFNKGLMTGVIKAEQQVLSVRRRETGPNRNRKFCKNLTYPGRLINNLLQGNGPAPAMNPTGLFVIPRRVAGSSDVGTKWKIPKSDADFGQTFGQWGWKPGCFIMLPILT